MIQLKKMPAHVRAILYTHQRFLGGDPSAALADLRGADLNHMDFRGVNLSQANLSRANLEGAMMTKVNFTGANLAGANLHTATIKGANFTNALLSRAFLAFVSFEKVNLTGADLSCADLQGTNLGSAIFSDDANSRLQMSKFRIVPEGDIIGWKKLRDGMIAKLLVPKEARRSNGFNRRCRAEFVDVVSIINTDDEPVAFGYSKRTRELKYVVGERCTPDGWDEDWKNECSHGVNFFLTYEEADAY